MFSKRKPMMTLKPMILRRVMFVVTLLSVCVLAQSRSHGQTGSPCGATINAIVCENQKNGSPASEWDVSGAGDSSIQGFATDISFLPGQRVDFKVDTPASTFTIDIYRMGYYSGMGARRMNLNPVT